MKFVVTSRRPPYHRLDAARAASRMDSWRVLVGILILISVLSVFFRESNETVTYRGIATVEKKYAERIHTGETAYFLQLRIDAPWIKGAISSHRVEGDHWAALPVGGKVAVLYQRSRDGLGIEVIECGLIALP